MWETLADIIICNYPSLLTFGVLVVVIWYLVQDRQSLQRQRHAEKLTEKVIYFFFSEVGVSVLWL
jgi:hypothetical protein